MKKIQLLYLFLILTCPVFAQNVGIGTPTPSEKLHVVGNGRFTALSGVGTRMVVADANGVLGVQAIAPNNSWLLTGNTAAAANYIGTNNAIDFRMYSNGLERMTIESNGYIGIRTATPGNLLHMTNGGVVIGGTAMSFFENASVSGVALNGTNTNATSGYNAIEGINNYNGTAFIPAGVFGLALYQGAALAPTIGVRGHSNEWQGTGIYGSRFNSGGANTGWGGQIYDDLGYTGFLGTISDARTKKEVQTIDNATSLIMNLRPVTYLYDLEKYPNMGLSHELEYGFIAQEVESVLPEVTRRKNFNTQACVAMKSGETQASAEQEFVVMDYTRIIPIATKAIQEQQTVIESQSQEIDLLKSELVLMKQELQALKEMIQNGE